MKKNLSYREKLLELSKIYRINEVNTYIKNKKYLTTPQLEHILKKNNVPIPTEINKSIIEIHSKKITKPVSSASNAIIDFFYSITNALVKFFRNIKSALQSLIINTYKFIRFVIRGIIFRGIVNAIYSFYKGVLNFCSFISKGTVNILNSAYNLKIEQKSGNKFILGSVVLALLSITVLGGIKVTESVKEKEVVKIQTFIEEIFGTDNDKVITKKEAIKAPTKSKDVVKSPTKKPKVKTEIAKAPIEDSSKKKQNKVREFILPDLNIKTQTILTLFAEVEYDLKDVRKNKLVKPIYFTQFPKDLDQISSTQLKKDTFIKIVLPLVVAENEKILDDRFKLKKIAKKKMTSDKEKAWLRQKFKEYKVKNGKVLELEKRMDIIPISIAIAQAAKESGWGTSRFALEGNAIFGQWTWTGRGIEPLNRSDEKKHKILRFPILRASVKAYKNNLNTHKGYREFREKRHKLRISNRAISGRKLIHTLDSYAATGEEYTNVLAKMMKQNALEDFENVKLTNSVVKKELNL